MHASSGHAQPCQCQLLTAMLLHLQVEAALQVEGQRIPNLTHPDVPLGGEENAAIIRMVGGLRV
jgi:hypothetical protein